MREAGEELGVARSVAGEVLAGQKYFEMNDNWYTNEAGDVELNPSIARGFPVFSLSGKFDVGRNNARMVASKFYNSNDMNSQEAGATKPLHTLEGSLSVLESLGDFCEGKSDSFETDYANNGLITYLRDHSSASIERKAERMASNQAESRIHKLALIPNELRKGFFWQELINGKEDPYDGLDPVFEGVHKIRAGGRGGMEDILLRNPDLLRRYFSVIVNIANRTGEVFDYMVDHPDEMRRYPRLTRVENHGVLERGDYIQGRFTCPGEGWITIDGEVRDDAVIEQIQGRDVYMTELDNVSLEGNGEGDASVKAYSIVDSSNARSIWRLEDE